LYKDPKLLNDNALKIH